MRKPPVALTLLSLVVAGACVSPVEGPGPERATLGIRTAAPDEDQANELGLTFDVRWQGQVIEELLVPDGPAGAAGLRPGDALVGLDDNDVYSQDDIRDFLMVSRPGQEVTARIRRHGADAEETVRLALGAAPSDRVGHPGLTWHYASLGQLDDALAQARAENKKVLVGLSGAET